MLQTVKDRAEEEQRKKDKRAALMRPSRANSAPVMSPAKEQSQHSPSASPRRTQGEHGTLNKTYLKLGCSYIARGHVAAQRSMLSMTQGSVMLGTARHVLGGSPAYNTACSDSSPEKPGHAVAARSHRTCSCCTQSQQLPQRRTDPAARPQASQQTCSAPAGTDATSMHRSAQIKSPQRHGLAQEAPASPVPAATQAQVQPHPSPLISGLPPPSPLRRGARAAKASAQPGNPAEEAATDMAMQAIVGVVDTQCSSPVVAGQVARASLS